KHDANIRRTASWMLGLATLLVASVAGATEPSGLPAAMAGSSMTGMITHRPTVLVVSDAPWLTCDDSAAPCPDGHSHAFTMNTMPKWDLKLELPQHMSVRG